MSASKTHKNLTMIMSLTAYIVVATACAPQPDADPEKVRVSVSFDVPNSMVPDSSLEVRSQFHEAFQAIYTNENISNIDMSVGSMDISEQL